MADISAMLECSKDDPGMAGSELFLKFFHAGHVCYVLEMEKAILGYAWLFLNNYSITHDAYERGNFTVGIEPDTAFLGNVFVAPDWRQRGLYSALLHGIAERESAQRAITRVVVDVKANNAVSLTAHKKRGFRPTCTLYHIATLGLAVFIAVPRAGLPRIYAGNTRGCVPYRKFAESPETQSSTLQAATERSSA